MYYFFQIMTIAFFALFQILVESRMPEDFVNVKDEIPSIYVDARYYTSYNFIGYPIYGYLAPNCYLTREATEALKKVQDDLRPFGLSLKILDAYRPQLAVDHFVEWAKDSSDYRMQAVFYPDMQKEKLLSDGYIAEYSSHSRGSTVDVTIVPLKYEQPPMPQGTDSLNECDQSAAKRFMDGSLDMGTGFDCFHKNSTTANRNINAQQHANRLLLKTLMEKHGFKNYEKEWWHYTLQNEPFPETYFNFLIK
jgi:D-alanyl-D-alanine dipeptidase